MPFSPVGKDFGLEPAAALVQYVFRHCYDSLVSECLICGQHGHRIFRLCKKTNRETGAQALMKFLRTSALFTAVRRIFPISFGFWAREHRATYACTVDCIYPRLKKVPVIYRLGNGAYIHRCSPCMCKQRIWSARKEQYKDAMLLRVCAISYPNSSRQVMWRCWPWKPNDQRGKLTKLWINKYNSS